MNNERIRYLKEEHWNQRTDLQDPAGKRVCTHYFGNKELSWMQDFDLEMQACPLQDEWESRTLTSHWLSCSQEDVSQHFKNTVYLSSVQSILSSAATTAFLRSADRVDSTLQNNRVYFSTPQVMVSFPPFPQISWP
jgi:hypothetical protein